MGWGYRHGTGTLSQEHQRKKKLVNVTETGTKVYKSESGTGVCKITVLWHDNRHNSFGSHLIVKRGKQAKHSEIDDLKTQKEVYQFAERMIKELC